MLKLQRRVRFTPRDSSRVREGWSLLRPSPGNMDSPTHTIWQTLTELWMGWVGEEDNAGAGGYSSCSYHRVHELGVEGYITGPQCITGIVAAEDDSAVAVVVVLVPGIDYN